MRELERMSVFRGFMAAAVVAISAMVLPIAASAQQPQTQEPGIGSPAQDEPRNTGRAETNDDVARRNQAMGTNENDDGNWGWVGLLGLAGLLGLRRRDPYEGRMETNTRRDT